MPKIIPELQFWLNEERKKQRNSSLMENRKSNYSSGVIFLSLGSTKGALCSQIVFPIIDLEEYVVVEVSWI